MSADKKDPCVPLSDLERAIVRLAFYLLKLPDAQFDMRSWVIKSGFPGKCMFAHACDLFNCGEDHRVKSVWFSGMSEVDYRNLESASWQAVDPSKEGAAARLLYYAGHPEEGVPDWQDLEWMEVYQAKADLLFGMAITHYRQYAEFSEG